MNEILLKIYEKATIVGIDTHGLTTNLLTNVNADKINRVDPAVMNDIILSMVGLFAGFSLGGFIGIGVEKMTKASGDKVSWMLALVGAGLGSLSSTVFDYEFIEVK